MCYLAEFSHVKVGNFVKSGPRAIGISRTQATAECEWAEGGIHSELLRVYRTSVISRRGNKG